MMTSLVPRHDQVGGHRHDSGSHCVPSCCVASLVRFVCQHGDNMYVSCVRVHV